MNSKQLREQYELETGEKALTTPISYIKWLESRVVFLAKSK